MQVSEFGVSVQGRAHVEFKAIVQGSPLKGDSSEPYFWLS